MIFKDFTTDGDYFLTPSRGNVTTKAITTVVIVSNPNNALTFIGFADKNDAFVQYSDGLIMKDGVVNHGIGIKLMLRILGHTTGVVTIGYSV